MNTPKIRFKGCTDAWEQRKLGEWCDFLNGDRSSNYPSVTDFVESGIPFVGSDSLGSTLVDKTKLRFITNEKYEQMNGLKIEANDILYTLRGAGFGKCSIADFTRGTVASSLVGIRCKETLRAKFLIQWLSSSNADNEKNKAVNGSTAQNISVEDMKKYTVSVPSVAEQDIISEFLYNLDNLIALYQRKCDRLNAVKKYMLQKMFPQNGAKVPEIRFKGFTGDWEQRRLSDVSQITMGQSPDGSTYSYTPSTYILVQGNADLKDGWVSPRIWTTQKTKTADAGDLIMSVRAPAGAMGKTAYDVVLGRGVAGIKGNEFLYQTLVKMDETGYWKKLAAGSTFESINSASLNNAEIMVPQDIGEQTTVGEYFSNLDNLITLHQRKCDSLKELKKFMLQNMFP